MERREFIVLGGAAVLSMYHVPAMFAESSASAPAQLSASDAAKAARWLRNKCTGIPTADLIKKHNFLRLLATFFPQGSLSGVLHKSTAATPTHINSHVGKKPLSNAAIEMGQLKHTRLAHILRTHTSVPDDVHLVRNRYLVASGCMSQCGLKRALIWIDTGKKKKHNITPKMIIAVINSGSPNRHILIFSSSDLTETGGTVPHNFRFVLAGWLRKHQSARKWDGGPLNRMNFSTNSNRLLTHLAPADIGIHRHRHAITTS